MSLDHSLLKDFIEIYKEAELSYDVDIRTECLLSYYQYLLFADDVSCVAEYTNFFKERIDILLASIMKGLEEHNGDFCLKIRDFLSDDVKGLPIIIYYTAMMYYEKSQYSEAIVYFNKVKDMFHDRELLFFFLGNCYVKENHFTEASICYNKALCIKKCFTEARKNLNIINNYQCNIEMYPWKSALMCNRDEYKDWPIFINSRDRVGCLRVLINWLVKNGYCNIIILDNDSTYDELLNYYKEIEEKNIARIIYLEINMGHRALWNSGILEKLNITTPYVYTDSDVVPDIGCPDNIVQVLYDVLKKYQYLYKVGIAIKTSDITYKNAEYTRADQQKFFKIPIEPGVYMAAVDTTFALHRNYRNYSLVNVESMRVYIRGAELLHLPWYYDIDNLPEDEKYYVQNANNSSTFASDIKMEGSCVL